MSIASICRYGVLYGLLFLLCITPRAAYGYIDPGTGSFVLQVLVGAALGSLMALKIFWRRIVSFVRGLVSRREQP
ncbi:MAG: hypothetical protein BWX88_04858 [Planctomycetes bacterium ADurb.Bin126]|nr:MAG: hypothetical protein BWX88_04858 [Planctomycetes bacterium ADurb.Bin126]HOD83827.1 hypothetical protein [Phycisphaerae bacterium]HQL74312.1 hypothetical protein [Phycisphaerae bacterium]